MRRKDIIALLSNGSMESGITVARALDFEPLDYGWRLNADDASSRDALLVDSYLNVQERLFDLREILDFLRPSGPWSLMPYGITCGTKGLLFETGLGRHSAIPTTDLTKTLQTADLVAGYEGLDLWDKMRLVELFFEPSAYTLLVHRDGAERWFKKEGRVCRNTLRV